jgi:peptide/nickel transport system permease protein
MSATDSTRTGNTEGMSQESVLAKQEREGRTYWSIVRSQFRKNQTGMAGLWIVILIVVTALLSPLLANDRPIVTKHKGSLEFPAFTGYVDSWVFWPSARYSLKSWKVGDSFPFGDHYKALDGKTWKQAWDADQARPESEREFAFTVWPPVRWGPQELDKSAVKQISSDAHLWGTDDRGRDVLARIIHGSVVAVSRWGSRP